MYYTDEAANRAKELRAKFGAVIDGATRFAFLFDGRVDGVVLSGPVGEITLYEDGSAFSGVPEYTDPCYTGPSMKVAKRDAMEYLRLALPLNEEERAANITLLQERAKTEEPRIFTLAEKGDQWVVCKPPTTVWLEWATVAWWEVSQETPPAWAAAMRSSWDAAWAQSHAWEQRIQKKEAA